MKHKTLYITLLGTALLFVGCTPQPVVEPAEKVVKKTKAKPKAKAKKRRAPAKPKKDIKLKEVEDTNFSSEYMYPEAKTKKAKPVAVAKVASTETTAPTATSSMGKGECISMIGQEKFDKYTQMLGDEASAIKRCKMLKAM